MIRKKKASFCFEFFQLFSLFPSFLIQTSQKMKDI